MLFVEWERFSGGCPFYLQCILSKIVVIWHVTYSVTLFFIFICPCIVIIIPNYNQQDATFLDLFISTDAPHVSGGSSAHRQEHITVHTASGIVSQYCCLL